MANYNTTNQLGGTPQAMTTTYKTVLSVYSSSGTAVRRGKVYDVLVGVDGTPADNAMVLGYFPPDRCWHGTSADPLPLILLMLLRQRIDCELDCRADNYG